MPTRLTPFSDDEAFEMALRAMHADSLPYRVADLARIILRLKPPQRPAWLQKRLAATPVADTHCALAQGEMFALVELLLGKSGLALDRALNDYSAAMGRGENPVPGQVHQPEMRP